MAGLISRGFLGRRRPPEVEKRLPPGQYLVTDFPVLSAGPTPHTPHAWWEIRVIGRTLTQSEAKSIVRRQRLTATERPSRRGTITATSEGSAATSRL